MNKKLIKNSFIYVIGDVLNKALPFFMLPILTRYLTPEDYGIVSIFTILVSIFAVFTGLSINGVINVNFFKMEKYELKVFIGNCLIILNISTIVVFISVLLIHPFILEKLNLEIEWIILAVILAFAQFLTTINLLLWIAEQNPKLYSLYQLSQTFMITSLSILMIIGFSMNWKGQLLATAIGTIFFSIISFTLIINRGYLIFKPNKEHIKDALKFGVPLIPHALSGLIKTSADRLILMSLLGSTITGIYSVAFQIGMVIAVITSAINKAWAPYLFNTLSNNPSLTNKIKIVKFSYFYFIGILLMAILFNYLAQYLIPHFLGKDFLKVSELVLYFSLSFAFDGMYYMVTNYLFYVKKTYILAYVTFGTSIIHIALLYYLINLNSVVGAAQASVISFATTFILVWYLSNKFYPMPWFKIFNLRKE